MHLGWYKRPDHPHYPGEIPPDWQVEQEFRAVHYVNDINRPYTEVLMVSDEEGNYTASYLYGLERIMAENVEGIQPERFDPLYYLYDGLGSAVQLVNGEGEVWNRFMYEPFGRPKAAGKLLLNRHKEELLYVPFGFTGEAHDFYNGLIYLRARYYDPEVGSFISRDSYLGNLMRPLSQNRYIYVENNPMILV
jgi:RHS repeat-associated protein